jgi:hypothetical protein
MKQEFEMLQSEMDDIIAINKNMPPVMKFGDYWSGMDLAERINEYWKVLGDKYGFEYLSVEGSAKGHLFFLATPKEKVIPKTRTEIEIDKYIGESLGYMSYQAKEACSKIVEQLEKCNYENEAGALNTNIAFLALKKLAN